jgi:hypothetical protein
MPNLNHTARIIELLATEPHLSRREVAERVGCTVGRVGEVVRAGGVNYSPRTASAQRGRAQGRKFGVELEFIGDRREVCNAMRSQGLDCNIERYNHRNRRTWKIVPDASVSGGAELVSPVLRGEDGREQVRKACAALQAAGATVNRSTGLHVHHDARSMTLDSFKRLARVWYESQQAVDQLVAPSRRGDRAGYCRPLTERDVTNVEAMTTLERRGRVPVDRDKSLNLSSFNRHGTVEVRQHQGTIDADKVLAWVDFGQAMLAFAESDAPLFGTTATADALLDRLTIADEAAAFLRDRADHFMAVAS